MEIECNAYVDVWNCQAKIMLDKQTPLVEEKLSEQQREALEKLKDYVIYTENGGAINWSGIYPFSVYSLNLLRSILAGDVSVIHEIEEPTDKDFRKKAEEMIKALENDELIMVYDSALAYGCSDWCQGYHQHEYIAKKDEKYLLVDDGYGHHCTFLIGRDNVASIGIIIKEIKVEDAIERLVSYLKKLAKRHDWTKRELENYEDEEGYTLYKCPKCQKYDIISCDFEHYCEAEEEEED